MMIQIENEYASPIAVDYEKIIRDVVSGALLYVNCPYEAEVNVLLTDNANIQEINKEQREIDAPTDVLSFPMIEYVTPADFSGLDAHPETCFNRETGDLLLGDIVVSIDKVKEQAADYGHSETRELAFLIAHSMLHLCGFDHIEEEERLDMEAKQEAILNQLHYTRD